MASCAYCEGKGVKSCAYCDGSVCCEALGANPCKFFSDECSHCESGNIICPVCNGSGEALTVLPVVEAGGWAWDALPYLR